jgi:hypothetical protein
MGHVLSIDAVARKNVRVNLRKLETKIFSLDFSFVSNFLKFTRTFFLENASIDRT